MIDRQRDELEKINKREQHQQKRLLSRHKTRASEADKLSREGHNGYDQYRSNAYLPEAEAKHGYSLDAGSVINKGHSSVSNKY